MNIQFDGYIYSDFLHCVKLCCLSLSISGSNCDSCRRLSSGMMFEENDALKS